MKNEKKIVPLLLRSIYLPIFLFIPQAFAQQQNHSETDFIYREIHTITIDDKGDTTYDATAEVEKVWAYMSERSLDMKYFHETESPLSTIKKLRAELNKSSISSDNIFKEIPEREDVFLSSGKAYTIAIPKTIKRGDVFRCTYSEYYPNVLFAPILTIPTIDSVAEYTVIIKHPKNLHVSWKMYCFRASLLCAVDTSSRKVTILSFKNIPSVRSLEYFPFNAGHAAICFQFTKEGAAQPLDFFSWYAQRTSLEPSIDSARFAHVPLHIGSGMTDEAKLDSIYSYVKKTIRYIADERGENAYIPRKPSEVLDHKYGDCKDRAALVCALAKQAGCKVAMALLSTNPKPPFDVLHPSLFNHVICAFSKQQQMLFFDPTSAYCEFNNLPYKDCETRAYILDAQNPRYENIFRPVQLPSLVLNFHASLDSLDRSVVEITLRNDNAFYARHALHDLTSDQLKLFLQNLINTQLYQIHVGTFQLLSDDGQSLRFQGKADLTKYIIPLGNKYCFPKTVFKVFDNEILERERDRFPIMIAHPVQLELSLALDAPGYSITKEQTFIGQQESQAFATSVLAQAAPIITASYTYTVQPTRYEAAAKAALIAFQREYFKNKKNMFILTKD